jgi:hypothetical protein
MRQPLHPQKQECALRERDIAVFIALAALDVEQHAGAINLRDGE